MHKDDELSNLASSAPIVVFRSPITGLGGLDRELNAAGCNWRDVELGMGDSANRERFRRLQALTGHDTPPQIFADGEFVGGLEHARRLGATVERPPTLAAWMGYLGLLPFVAGLFGVLAALEGAGIWLVGYGAVILSFVGAIQWGLAIRDGANGERGYAVSVIPALIGWLALLLPIAWGLAVLAVSFPSWLSWEMRYVLNGLPRWFRQLRIRLTIGATISLAGGWVAFVTL